MTAVVMIVCVPQDAQEAKLLAGALRAAGQAVVIAHNQASLAAALQQGVQPQQVIVLLSRAAVVSATMQAAVRQFREQNAHIIPVLIEPLAGETLAFRYVDATYNTEKRLHDLARKLTPKQTPSAQPSRLMLNLLALGSGLLALLVIVALLVFSRSTPTEVIPTLFVAAEVSQSIATAPPIPQTMTAVPTAAVTPTVITTAVPEETAELSTTVEATSEAEPSDSAQAAFVVDTLGGYAPLVVTFSNTSTGEISSYAWDFDGDGGIDSDARDPLPFTFTEPGGYQAVLTVTFADGTTSSAIEFLEVYPAQTSDTTQLVTTNSTTGTTQAAIAANFGAQPIAGAVPLTVTFTNQSSGQDIRYAWDFNGDGETDSTRRDPAPYTYREAGQYEVRLRVSTLVGQTTEHRLTIQAGGTGGNDNLVAAFVPRPSVGPAPLVVTFSNHSFGDGITAYAWDFNSDGVTDSTAENPPAYTYQTSGQFTATLHVTGAAGRVVSQTRQITVQTPPPPTAAFSSSPFFGTAPLIVTVNNYSIGAITAYAWDFNGDGVTDSTAANPPPYTYTTAGLHTIQLVVSGPGGVSEPVVEYVIVEEALLPSDVMAEFSLTPTTGSAPLVVSFTNLSTGDIASYAWDFNGDGMTDSSDANPPPYTYTTAGSYTVTLTVTGADGITQTASQGVSVTAPLISPTAAFTLTPAAGSAPLVVSFSNLSTGDIASYAWDFNGDGMTDSSDAAPPPYTYTEAGSFTVTLTVTGVDGSTQTAAQVVSVTAPVISPTAAFALTPAAGSAPLVVSFSNLSTGDIASYAWDFNGDGMTDSSNVAPPPYTYTEAGSFTVTLTVTGVDGSTQTTSQVVMIATALPTEDEEAAVNP